NFDRPREIKRQKSADQLQTRLGRIQRGLPKVRIAFIPVQANRTGFKRLPGEAVILVTYKKSFALKSASIRQSKLITPSHHRERAQNILPGVEMKFSCPICPDLKRLHMSEPLCLIENDDGHILDLDRSLDRSKERDPIPKLHRSAHIFQLDSRLS